MECNDSFSELNTSINVILILTQETAETLKRFDAEWKIISDRITQIQNGMKNDYNQNNLNHLKSILQGVRQEEAKAIYVYRSDIVEKLKDQYLKVEVLLKRIIDVELTNWKRNQQLAGNGAEFDTGHLDILQTWCENLAEIVWTSFTQTKEAKRLCEAVNQQLGDMPDILNALNDIEGEFHKLLSTLVKSTFIIEKQPPQVLITNFRFSVKIRLLVGEKLNIHLNPPQVKVSIISEPEANRLLCGKVMLGDSSGEISNDVVTMEYEQSTKQLSATFGNMRLESITRNERRGSESVVDEKFSLYFSSNFPVGSEPNCHVWTLSSPVIVIVHGNQEPRAWATITWYNAFTEPDRKSLAVPERVSWNEVSKALNMKFRSAAGKPLSVENLNFIAEKLLRVSSNDYDTFHVSWSQFCKEPLPDRNFTFWDWFYGIMELIRDELIPLWMDGIIHGFVHERQAEEMLSSCPVGTFLLRFSDSELGGITVACVEAGNGGQATVTMTQPLTAEGLFTRSLLDRLNDFNHLIYLYPNISKKEAFGKYYTQFFRTVWNRSMFLKYSAYSWYTGRTIFSH